MIKSHTGLFIKRIIRLSYAVGITFLLGGLLLSLAQASASASEDDQSVMSFKTWTPTPACIAPDDWDQTLRFKTPRLIAHDWPFTVEDAEMDVTIIYFYYQDYSKPGCPYDCSSGECQTDETGVGDTPLGSVVFSDGVLKPHHVEKKLEGRLSQGAYVASFHVTGDGSINVGVKIIKSSLPTQTSTPTNTPTDTPTSTPTDTPTSTEPPPTETNTPTVTRTPTGTPPTPSETATLTPTKKKPTPTNTKTPHITILPPETSTPTRTPPLQRTPSTATPPATLPPPPLPSGSPQPPVLVPVTGISLSDLGLIADSLYRFLITAGVGLVGLGIVVQGIDFWLNRRKK